MDKAWIKQREQELKMEFKREQERICEGIRGFDFLPKVLRDRCCQMLSSMDWRDPKLLQIRECLLEKVVAWVQEHDCLDLFYQADQRLYDLSLCEVWKFPRLSRVLVHFKDSEPVVFDGDVLITDPYYFIKEKDWEKSRHGKNLSRFGIINFMTRDTLTLTRDWACTVTDPDTGDLYGASETYSRQVCIADLAQVLAYNPDYKPGSVFRKGCVLKGFKGTIQVIVSSTDGQDGTIYGDFQIRIIGDGVHKETGKPFRFTAKEPER